ncbi:hypothetical protein C2R75_07570 [Helicobacter pylori]|nr:hypothetical protein C2R75_07570 [Helicobacter pylori]
MQFESAFYLALKSGLYPNCEPLFRSLYRLMQCLEYFLNFMIKSQLKNKFLTNLALFNIFIVGFRIGRSQKAFPVRCNEVTDNVHVFYSYMFHFLGFYNRFY